MLEIVLWGGIFVFSLAILLKASDYFTDSAEEIGLFFKLPAFLIGVTIVALGTSLPELASSILAVLHGHSEIVAGNVVGSNIANIFLVLGVTAVVSTKKSFNHDVNVDLPILWGATFLIILSMLDKEFSFIEGILCVLGLIVFLGHTVFSRHVDTVGNKKIQKEIKENLKIKQVRKFPFKGLMILVASSFAIFIGAKYTVDSVVYFSRLFEIGTDIIAVSVVALGTSLPELVVSYTAARKGNVEMAVGNILGSNIFNALGVMGVSAMIGTLVISDSILYFGVPVMLVATFMYVYITQDKKITKWEGIFLLIFYIFYIGKLFGWL
jgi:cation:H+ antiporter